MLSIDSRGRGFRNFVFFMMIFIHNDLKKNVNDMQIFLFIPGILDKIAAQNMYGK